MTLEQKQAKRDYKLARDNQSEGFTKLRNHTFKTIIDIHKQKFDCGSFQVFIL